MAVRFWSNFEKIFEID